MPVRTLIPVHRTFVPPPPAAVNGTGKRIALLVGGFSLREHWSEEKAKGFDEVVAVNGAAFLFPCDYAVMVDRKVVLKLVAVDKVPRKSLVTYPVYQQHHLKPADRKRFKLSPIPSVGPKHKCYTFPRAMLLCHGLAGANGTIEVFGMDFASTGGRDVAGLTGDHGARRWRQEAEVLRETWRSNIVAVHGRVAADRLAFIRGERRDWPE